jgi:hypothetical protein
MRFETQFASINSGFAASSVFGLGAARKAALFIPVVTSCQMRLQGSIDQTSANFVTMQQSPPNSGDLVYNCDVGSKWFTIPADFCAPFARLLSSVNQAAAAVNSFAIVTAL